MIKLNLRQIESAVNGKINDTGFYDVLVSGVVTDSRANVENKLFIPFKGENFDAHDFMVRVFVKGAACSLSQSWDIESEDYPIIYVESMQKAILDLAAFYRECFENLLVVGITGSVGKTTTKDLIYLVLSQHFNTIKTEGNFNNEIGLPLTVFRMDKKTEASVLEMGMNHFGEIHNLSRVSKPNIAVITNIGVSHIEYLGSREGILKAKSEIFHFMNDDGKIVLCGDDDLLITLKSSRKNITFYGTNSDNDFYYSGVEYNGIESMKFKINQKSTGDSIKVSCKVCGKHIILNCLCAAAVGVLSGLSLAQIKVGIESFEPTENRMNIITSPKGVTIIDDVYNASPTSMKAAIDVLTMAKGKRISILGDMFELGNESRIYHEEIGDYLSTTNIDCVLTFGENSKAITDKLFNSKIDSVHFNNIEALINYANEIVNKNDTVLIKASRGMAFEKIVDKIN